MKPLKLLWLLPLLAVAANAQTVLVVTNPPPAVMLGWEQPVPPQGITITNYSLWIGEQSRMYTQRIALGKTNMVSRTLQRGHTYFFAVNATDSDGLHTDLSNEVSWTARTPLEPPMLWLTNVSVDVRIIWR